MINFGRLDTMEQTVMGGDVLVTNFDRDNRGNAVQIEYPHLSNNSDPFTLDYTYTPNGMLDTISRDGSVMADYDYAGKYVLSRAYPQANVYQDYSYDQFGRVDGIHSFTDGDSDAVYTASGSDVNIAQFGYGYDSRGNIDEQTFAHRPVVASAPARPTSNYGYDDLDRLYNYQ